MVCVVGNDVVMGIRNSIVVSFLSILDTFLDSIPA